MNKDPSEIVGNFLACLFVISIAAVAIYAGLFMVSRVYELEFNRKMAVLLSIVVPIYRLIARGGKKN